MAQDTGRPERFGRLRVIDPGKRIVRPSGSRSAALCRCDCGQEKLVSLDHLKSGKVTSCGCQAANRPHILIEPGYRAGMLTVLRETRDGRGERRLAVRCDCGTETTRSLYAVANGTARHCWSGPGYKPAPTAASKPPARPQRPVSLIGQRYGTRVVVDVLTTPDGIRAQVRCDCGSEQLTATRSLMLSKSCGCLNPGNTTHGMSHHELFDVWKSMMARCYKPGSKDYHNYGARGIQVHEPWHDARAFIEGIEAEIGPRPPGKYDSGQARYTLDRVNNNSGYCPGNVRWSTRLEQALNMRPRSGPRPRKR